MPKSKRSQLNRQSVSLAMRATSKIQKLDDETPDKFSNRFEYVSDRHTAAIVSGSTLAGNIPRLIERSVEATKTACIQDSSGVHTGAILVTADGRDNTATGGNAAAFANCNRFSNIIDCTPAIQKLDPEYCKKIVNNLKNDDKNQPYPVSDATLAATIVRRCETDGVLECVVNNVGDAMVLVIDQDTQAIRCVADAWYYPSEDKALSPVTVAHCNSDWIDSKNVEVKENDWIIHLSDGAWRELPYVDGEQDNSYRIDCEKLKTALSIEKKDDALAIADKLIGYIRGQAFEKRQQFVAARKAYFDRNVTLVNDDNYTLAMDLKKHGKSELSEQLAPYVSLDMPQSEAATILSQWQEGTDTTVAVMRVPDHGLELCRALIKHANDPDKAKALVARLKQEAIAKKIDVNKVVKDNFNRLICEVILKRNQDNNGCRRADFPNKKIKATTLDKIGPAMLACATYLSQETKKTKLLPEVIIDTTYLNTVGRNMLYEAARKMSVFNQHRRPKLDWLIGKDKTTSCQDAIHTLRHRDKLNALTRLEQEVNKEKDPDKKLALLKRAREMPLFAEHRSNYMLSGAWGRTSAVQQIDDWISEVKKMKKQNRKEDKRARKEAKKSGYKALGSSTNA